MISLAEYLLLDSVLGVLINITVAVMLDVWIEERASLFNHPGRVIWSPSVS